MSGTPGIGVNNPEGFVSLSDPGNGNLLTINVASITGNVSVPLSVLPFFRNDGGVRSYGGATHISIFEDGVAEGVSSADVAAASGDITTIGSITLTSPDPQKIYKIRIRLRSAAGDPNYKDDVMAFRVVTPLAVPMQFETIPDAELPEITYVSATSNFHFATTPVTTEIRIRTGGDGILLPTTTANFGAAAKAWLLDHLDRLRDGVFIVDFLSGGGYDCTARVIYAFKWTGASYTITKYRRKDFSRWNQYGGSDFGIAQAAITSLSPVSASLTFVRKPLGRGPEFDTIVAIGKRGSLDINPASVVIGSAIDITSIVDATEQRFLRRFGQTDQNITLIGLTDTQIIVRNIPLWDQVTSLHNLGGQRLITNVSTPPTYLFYSRSVIWPYLNFPNFSTFYDMTPAAVQVYPRLEDIKLYDQSGTLQATWATDALLSADLVSLKMPEAGLQLPVLDVRSYLSSTDSWYELEATVVLSATPGDEYTVRQQYPLNLNGEPTSWTRTDIDVVTEIPTFTFNGYGELEITTPSTWTATTPFTFVGSIGSVTGGAHGASTTTVYSLGGTVISRLDDYVEVRWYNASAQLVSFRVPTTAGNLQLVGTDDIDVFFDGNTVMFPPGGLANVAGSTKDITISGDLGSVTIYDAQESTVYRIGVYGAHNNILPNPSAPYIDVSFTGSSGAATVRVHNTFYDYREQNHEETTLAVDNRGGVSTSGLVSVAYAFSLPRMRWLPDTDEIEFEDDGSNALYQTAHVRITNGKSGGVVDITGSLLLGTAYSLGAAALQATAGVMMIAAARHRNGEVTVVAYPLSESYTAAVKLTPDGSL